MIPLIPWAPPALARTRSTGAATAVLAGERPIAIEWRRIEHGNERLQVLADEDVERDGEGRLVALRLHERGAIALGKQGERECERQEGDRHGRRAGAAAERDSRQARTDAAMQRPPRDPYERTEQACRGDGGRECDQPREQEQDEPAATAPSSCDSSAAPPTRAATTTATAASAATSSGPKRPRSRAGGLAVAAATTIVASTTTSSASPIPAGERTLSRSVAPTGAPARLAASAPTTRPVIQPTTVPTSAHRGALGHGQQAELPAARPEPGQASPRRLEVAAHRAGGKDREREEERRRLTADEEKAPPGDVGVVLHRAKLLHRRLDAEARRRDRECGARPLARADEVVDLPESRLPRRERPHPA